MKRLLLVLSLLAMTTPPARGQVSLPAAVLDSAAARIASPILNRLDRAWTAGDGLRFAAEFTEESDVINVSGSHLHGRSAIATQLQGMFSSVFKGSIHRARTLEMAQLLSDSIVLVVSSAIIDGAGPSADGLPNPGTLLLSSMAISFRHPRPPLRRASAIIARQEGAEFEAFPQPCYTAAP